MTDKNQNLATIGARVLGGVLDFIFVLIIGSVVVFIFFWIFPVNGYYTKAEIDVVSKGRGALIGLLVDAIYTVVLLSGEKQSTWGQRIVGVKLQRLDGNPITIGVAIGRWLMSIVSSVLLKIGFLVALFTKNKQTLHDLVVGTVVVNTKTNGTSSNQKNLSGSPSNDSAWEIASNELNSVNRREGLWAKCFAQADGDENKAKANYLKERVEQIRSEEIKSEEIKLGLVEEVIKSNSTNIFHNLSDEKTLKQKRFNTTFFSILVIIIFGVVVSTLFDGDKDDRKLSSDMGATLSRQEDIKISFNEPLYIAKVCSLNTFLDFNRCEKTEIRKARFLVYLSDVRIEYIYSDGVIRIETLKECVVKDEKNWNCGGVATTNVNDERRRSLMVSGLYQMQNGVITTESGTYTSYVDNVMQSTKYRPLPIFILNR